MKNIIIVLLLFIVGCAAPGMYYWGDYSSTLYNHKKQLTEESYSKHKNSLLDVIDQSAELDTKVPPGIYAELGFIFYQEGDIITGKKYFELEVELYPESAYFINQMIVRINESN